MAKAAQNDWRRGVVFIREIVPKAVIAAVARTVYNEQYLALPMGHAIHWRSESDRVAAPPGSVEYRWQLDGRWNFMRAATSQAWRETKPGSLEEFITEHYWGYVRQRDGATVEYEVQHPRWRVASADSAELSCAAAKLYGDHFAAVLAPAPKSAFIADGSAVTVYRGRRRRRGPARGS